MTTDKNIKQRNITEKKGLLCQTDNIISKGGKNSCLPMTL